MFLTGFFPYATFAIPGIAGAILCVLVIELDKKWAGLSFVLVSVLSAIIAPDKIAVGLFVVFLGWYPIIKSVLEQQRSRLIEYILKLLVFNVLIAVGILVASLLLGDGEIAKLIGNQGARYIALGLIVLNMVFIIYDFALTRIISSYIQAFKAKQKHLGENT